MMRANELRMLPKVHRSYVSRKSELTEKIGRYLCYGNIVYRTALVCECGDRQNVRHSGAIVIGSDGNVLDYVIRCKGCYSRKEADNGTI